MKYARSFNGECVDIAVCNWGKLVVDTLLKGLNELHKKETYPTGDMNFMVVRPSIMFYICYIHVIYVLCIPSIFSILLFCVLYICYCGS